MEHHNHNHTISANDINNAFVIGILLNAIYTAFEFGAGFYYNSLALLSDAGHNLSDVGSLLISLLGFKLARKVSSLKFTYGYKKATILASLLNAVILFIVVAEILKEAIERISEPAQPQGLSIIIVAAVGILINTISAFLFVNKKEKDLNLKGAFLHLMVDALVSFGVVLSGVLIYYTGWNIIDPIISMAIAIVIIISTWGLLTESIRLIADAVPKSVDINKIKRILYETKGINNIHHLHVWALSTTINALTAHLVVAEDITWQDSKKLKEELKHKLQHANIHHITIEFEGYDEECEAINCE